MSLGWEDDPTDAQHIPFLPEDEQNPETWEPVSISAFDVFVTVTCILCVVIVYGYMFWPVRIR